MFLYIVRCMTKSAIYIYIYNSLKLEKFFHLTVGANKLLIHVFLHKILDVINFESKLRNVDEIFPFYNIYVIL